MSAGNPLCAAISYGSDNNVDHVDEPLGSGFDRTCFGYDAARNLSTVNAGCVVSGGTDCSSCTTTVATYNHDDFGNVVTAVLPWTGSSTGAGTTSYDYDAMGNMTTRQTPSLAGTQTAMTYAYDGLGRRTNIQQVQGVHTYTPIVNYNFDTASPPAGCLTGSTYTLGRLASVDDSMGTTYLQYDQRGNLIAEARLRMGATSCAGPTTSYTYDLNDNLTSIVYPYGRTIGYMYGTGALGQRVASVTATTYSTGWASLAAPLLSNIVWEPYGRVRGYQMNQSPTLSGAVEYMLGDTGTSATGKCVSTAGSPLTAPSLAASSLNGNVRGVWVSTGAFTPGSPNGATFTQTYTYQADQLSKSESCLLAATAPRVDTYGYDKLLRLTSAVGGGTPAGPFSNTTYAYDGRGNRTSLNYGTTLSATMRASHSDQVSAETTTTTGKILAYNYTYADDGTVMQITSPNDSSGQPAMNLSFTAGPSAIDGGGAPETAYKSVSVNGASYTYYYDHQMRRRYKGYPSAGVSDEYFYSPRSELLVDQGNDSVSSPTVHPDDEYVWLDGRPVAMVRGQLSTANVRQADGTGACTRSGDGFNCGFYWIVTDPLGKPILMLDSARNIAGVGEYDPYGQVNRVSIDDETVHPYSATQATVLGNYNQSPAPGMTVDLRINFQVIDTRYWAGNQCSYSNNYDWVQLVDGDNTASILGGRYFGNHAKSQWSSWVTPSNGKVQAQFVVGCKPISSQLINLNCGCQSFTPSYTGAVAGSYEYRRHQSATPFWTPLRFPGQYHDEETDANQNWNRFYWPLGGRYLEPEPMLSNIPLSVMDTWGAAPHALTYTYASDNPLRFSDPNGREPCPAGSSCEGCIAMNDTDGPCLLCDNPEKTTCGPRDPTDPFAKCAKKAILAYDACIASGKPHVICVKAMEIVYQKCVDQIGPSSCVGRAPMSAVPVPSQKRMANGE